MLEQWQTIKDVASDALIANGGTITHHHAVGRVHRDWHGRQLSPPLTDALRAMKRSFDPQA